MYREMVRLETKPFTSALPRLLTLLNHILTRQGIVADVVCDDEEYHRFSPFAMLTERQRRDHDQSLRVPTFASSEFSPLLQIAEILADVLRRAGADRRQGRTSKPEIRRWFDLIGPQVLPLPSITVQDQQLHAAMMAEDIIRNAGGLSRLRDDLLDAATGLLGSHAPFLDP